MINSAVNDLYYSLILYLDHQILQKGRGYTNYSGRLYKMNDPELPNNSVYASPFKQWNWDHSISGSNVPTGVWINNVFCHKGTSGLKIDYLNGRIILSGGAAYQNLTVSGSYSVKDFNIYASTESDEELIFETKYEINPSYNKSLSGIDKLALTAPAIFVKNMNTSNDAESFGGLCNTTMNVHILILSKNNNNLDSLGNLLIDEKYSCYPITDKIPLNYYGDYRSGNYNYLNFVDLTGQPLAYIKDVDFYKLSNKDFSDKYPDLKIAMADFDISYLRFPNRNTF